MIVTVVAGYPYPATSFVPIFFRFGVRAPRTNVKSKCYFHDCYHKPYQDLPG
jgi:hypothetical protein